MACVGLQRHGGGGGGRDIYVFKMCVPCILHIFTSNRQIHNFFLNFNFSTVHVVCFLLGNSPASEFYTPTFRNTVCSETSAYKIQTPGNYPEQSIQHSEHGESLKSCVPFIFIICTMSQQMNN